MATSAAEMSAEQAKSKTSTNTFIVKIPLNAKKVNAKQWGSGSKLYCFKLYF
jgi:hypothetical protein